MDALGAGERESRGGERHGRVNEGVPGGAWRRLGAPGRSQAGREGGGGRRGVATRLRPSGEGGRRQGGGGGGLGRPLGQPGWTGKRPR